MNVRVRSRALLGLTTPLGPDVLVPVAFDAHEAISQPYQMHLRTVSERSSIAAESCCSSPPASRSAAPMGRSPGIFKAWCPPSRPRARPSAASRPTA